MPALTIHHNSEVIILNLTKCSNINICKCTSSHHTFNIHPALPCNKLFANLKKIINNILILIQQPTKDLLNKHYEDLSSKPFFPGLINYMATGPVVAMVSLFTN